MENCSVACPGIRKGGGQKSERLFFGYSIFQGGPAQNMMFTTKKVAKYRCNGFKFAPFFAFQFLGRGGGKAPSLSLDTRLFRQKLNDDNELLLNIAAKAEEISEEKLKQHNRRLPLRSGGS